jgi:hypothetical protein
MHQEEVIHVTDGLLLEVPKEKVELMNFDFNTRPDLREG